jgi:glycine/D-amino acid oxidase-like deaminating enzyme
VSSLDRRDFLKVAGVGAGALLTGCATAPGFLRSGRASSNIVVIGAGAFGGWTALNLQRMGARVTLVDMFGPGNSRSTSGDETRGVRTSYGDRPHGELWMRWANASIAHWKRFDAEFAAPARTQIFFTTGDLYMRSEWIPELLRTREWWRKNGIAHETLSPDDVRKRWPVIQVDDITAILYETNAGVVRARRATQLVAEVFQREGGRLVIGRVVPPTPGEFDGHTVKLTNGDMLSADAFVFAVGPWLGKTFALMQNRMRTPLGVVMYFATPPGDDRFTYPNLPTWNFPGTTGWAALPVDNRGFRVRGGGGGGGTGGGGGGGGSGAGGNPAAGPGNQPAQSPNQPPTSQAPAAAGSGTTPATENVTDPDLSSRWVAPERLASPRRFVTTRFPALKDAPIAQTWACHYESTSSRNFIVDRHPNLPNVWIAGGGNAEAFKMGPVLGEYVAKRVLGDEGDPAIARQFRIPETEFTAAPQRSGEE